MHISTTLHDLDLCDENDTLFIELPDGSGLYFYYMSDGALVVCHRDTPESDSHDAMVIGLEQPI